MIRGKTWTIEIAEYFRILVIGRDEAIKIKHGGWKEGTDE